MELSKRHKRWNVTIVVLLIMVSSGLLALLTLQYVKHFLATSSVLESYYKAYYMARGWLESLLTEANIRWYGFEHDLSQTPSLQANYYKDCTSLWLCRLQGAIVSHGKSISNSVKSLSIDSCDSVDMITLIPGASSAYPLFYDRGTSAKLSFAPVQTIDYQKLWDFGFDVTISWGSLDAYLYDAGQGSFGQITATKVINPPTEFNLFGQQSLTYSHRLILTNPVSANSAVSYCLKSDDAAQLLVGNFTTINSQATYGDRTVGVTAIKKFVFPSAFIQ